MLSPTAGLVGASHLLAASPAAEKVVQTSAGDEPVSAFTMGDAASPIEHSASPMEDPPPNVQLHGRVSKGEPPRTHSKSLPGDPIRLKQQALPRRGLHLPGKHDAEVSPAISCTTQVCHVAQSLFCKHLYAAQHILLQWLQLLFEVQSYGKRQRL